MRNQWVHTSAFINMEFNNRNLFQITPDTRPPASPFLCAVHFFGWFQVLYLHYLCSLHPHCCTRLLLKHTHFFSLYRHLLPPHYSLTMSSLNLTVYRDSCLTSSDSLHVTTANKKSGIIVEHCPLPLCENVEPKMEFILPNSKSAIKISFGLLKKIIE